MRHRVPPGSKRALPDSNKILEILYYKKSGHNWIAQSVWRLATGWRVRGSNPGEGEIFRTRPDQPLGSTSFIYDGYQIFPRGKLAGRLTTHRHLLYSPPVPSRHVVEQTFRLPLPLPLLVAVLDIQDVLFILSPSTVASHRKPRTAEIRRKSYRAKRRAKKSHCCAHPPVTG